MTKQKQKELSIDERRRGFKLLVLIVMGRAVNSFVQLCFSETRLFFDMQMPKRVWERIDEAMRCQGQLN